MDSPVAQAGVPPPPLLGHAPINISQLLISLGDKAAHFQGPVASGRPGEIQGSALLNLFLHVDYTMGSFSLPIQFPTDAMLLWACTLVYAPFTGGSADTTFQLGTGSGRNDILTADGMGPIHTTSIKPVTGTLPFSIDPNPGQCWITVTGNSNTAGNGGVILIYLRPFQKRS
jgi:hypothetical protein